MALRICDQPRTDQAPGVPHVEREAFRPSEPVQVTLRADRDVGSLRTRAKYAAIREATITVLKHEDFRIVHVSIQGTHIHLLVEAEGRTALSKGMKAFGVSAAKHINAAVANAGSWWKRAKRRREALLAPDPKVWKQRSLEGTALRSL